MQKRFVTAFALAFLIICLTSPCKARQIVEKPQNNLVADGPRVDDSLRFDHVLVELSQKYQIALVCESRPLSQTPQNAEAVSKLEQAMVHPNQNVDEQIQTVASAFDYTAIHTNAKTFLLQKRYTTPGDLPEVTLQEADTSFRNIIRALKAFDCHDAEPSGLVVKLLAEATPEQKTLLTQGVSITDLSASQRASAWQLAAFGNIGRPLTDIQFVSNRLAGLRRGTATLGRSDYAGLLLPCYEGNFGPHRESWKVYLSYLVRTYPGGGTALALPPGVKYVDGKIVGTVPDPTAPGNTPNMVRPSSESFAFQKSLGQVAAIISEKLIASDTALARSGITKIEADPAISRKTICLFGEVYLTPEQLLGAITELYNLRAPKTRDGVVQLTLLTPKFLDKGSDIPAEVERLLPASFLRAMLAKANPKDKPTTLSTLENVVPDRIYEAAIKRLREIVEPRIDAAQDKKLLFQDLTAEVGDLAALSSLATCYGAMRNLAIPKNPLLDNMDKAVLKASIEKNRAVYSIAFEDVNGKKRGVRGDLPIPGSN